MGVRPAALEGQGLRLGGRHRSGLRRCRHPRARDPRGIPGAGRRDRGLRPGTATGRRERRRTRGTRAAGCPAHPGARRLQDSLVDIKNDGDCRHPITRTAARPGPRRLRSPGEPRIQQPPHAAMVSSAKMGPPWRQAHRGRFEEGVVESVALRDNPLGDPATRPILVYLPPGYDQEPDRRYPSIYMIQSFTGQLDMWQARGAFRPTLPELVDALMSGVDAPPPAGVVFVDCWTSLGGSQFLDSPAIGRYHTHLCEEVVPWVDSRYRTLAAAGHRGIGGKSSGGYGALVTCMLRPDIFGGLADHAGDAVFENCYLPDFRRCARVLRDHYGGSYQRFWEDFRSRPAMSRDGDGELVNAWAMAAAYSADPDGTVQLPFDTATGQLVPEVWERWLAWDPVRMAPHHADALRSLRAVYLDAGRSDEWFLDLGTEAVRRVLADLGVRNVSFELFDGGHLRIVYHSPLAIRFRAERLTPPLAG